MKFKKCLKNFQCLKKLLILVAWVKVVLYVFLKSREQYISNTKIDVRVSSIVSMTLGLGFIDVSCIEYVIDVCVCGCVVYILEKN